MTTLDDTIRFIAMKNTFLNDQNKKILDNCQIVSNVYEENQFLNIKIIVLDGNGVTIYANSLARQLPAQIEFNELSTLGKLEFATQLRLNDTINKDKFGIIDNFPEIQMSILKCASEEIKNLKEYKNERIRK